QRDANVVDVIEFERASDTALGPARTEHEVLDDQLAASVEQIRERLLAVRSVEHVLLLDLDPREIATLAAQSVAKSSEFLFLGQQFLASGKPLVSRYDPVLHCRLPSCVGDVVGKALEATGPTALMRIARHDRLKDALVQSALCVAPDIAERHGDQCLVARVAVGVFRGIGEHKPLRLDDLAIDAALAV